MLLVSFVSIIKAVEQGTYSITWMLCSFFTTRCRVQVPVTRRNETNCKKFVSSLKEFTANDTWRGVFLLMDHLVDFSIGDIVKVHSMKLEKFKEHALNNTKKRYRWCNHKAPDSVMQDMFLCRTRGDYSRPDKHINMPESHTIIEGREAIVLFTDEGDICDAFILDRDGGYLSYRINSDIYHMTIPLTEIAIDYEVKLGPFTPDTNIFPEWAPKECEYDKAMRFLQEIEEKLYRFIGK